MAKTSRKYDNERSIKNHRLCHKTIFLCFSFVLFVLIVILAKYRLHLLISLVDSHLSALVFYSIDFASYSLNSLPFFVLIMTSMAIKYAFLFKRSMLFVIHKMHKEVKDKVIHVRIYHVL